MDGHHVTEKKKGQVQIKIWDNNGKSFITTLYNVLLAPDLCDRLFSIIKLMNAGHSSLFQKVFCTVYSGADNRNAVTLPHSSQSKHAFTGKIKNISKKNKFPARKKIDLELLHKSGDSLQLTNWILDSGATCHMMPEVLDFIPGSLEDTDKYIEVSDGHHVMAKQNGQVRIQMYDDYRNTFIATLHNVLLAPELCDGLFSIITLMNSGHTCLFNKGFCTVYFGADMRNAATLPHSAQRKHDFTRKIKNMSKKN